MKTASATQIYLAVTTPITVVSKLTPSVTQLNAASHFHVEQMHLEQPALKLTSALAAYALMIFAPTGAKAMTIALPHSQNAIRLVLFALPVTDIS